MGVVVKTLLRVVESDRQHRLRGIGDLYQKTSIECRTASLQLCTQWVPSGGGSDGSDGNDMVGKQAREATDDGGGCAGRFYGTGSGWMEPTGLCGSWRSRLKLAYTTLAPTRYEQCLGVRHHNCHCIPCTRMRASVTKLPLHAV